MFTDTHAHLTSSELFANVEEILHRAKLAKIDKIVNICTDIESLKQGLLLHKKHSWVYNTAATTPHDVAKEGELFFPIVEEKAREGELIAIGETGLDYFYEHSPKNLQNEFLTRYLALAKECSLPLVFHCRDAFSDLFARADAEYKGCSAVLHCFTGSVTEAKGVVDRGWFVSFSGIVTFKKSEALREAAKYVPLDSILIETDAPYLAPQSKRGKTNEPAFVVETAAFLAELKGVDAATLADVTSSNAEKFFSFSKR